MKFLVSSKELASKLNSIDFEVENVERVTCFGNEITIITNKGYIKCYVSLLVNSKDVNQYGRRWDWIKNLVNKVDEQPIVLELYENVSNVIFQY